MTTQAALKELQSFKQLLQQMAKALRCTQSQNNLPGSKQASWGKRTKWDNYSAQWLEKGFGGLVWKKKPLKLLAQRKVVRQKYSLVVSDTRQVILLVCKTRGAIQLAPTIPWSTRRKTDVCVTGVTLSSFFLSWKKLSHSLPPQLSPAHDFLWACKPWTDICVKCFSLQPHKCQGYHKADAVAGSKKEWPGMRRRVNITQHHFILW